jgi:peroxiredoxin
MIFRLFIFLLWLGIPAISQAQHKLLKDSLDYLSASLFAKLTGEEKSRYLSEIKDVETRGLLFGAKNQKDKTPDFSLTDISGKTVSLHAALENGPVILFWYRGSWSPYCTLTLRYMQRMNKEFLANGAMLMALSAEKKEKAARTAKRFKITYPLLSDTGNTVARSFGLVYPINEELQKQYEKDFKWSGFYSSVPSELPLTALYIIHPNQKIVYAHVQADYRNRAEPGELLRVLKGMMFPARTP